MVRMSYRGTLSIFVIVCLCGIANGLKRFCPKMTMNGAIIGGGRIGNLLYEGNDKKDVFLSSRTDTLPSSSSGPIYICTRNNDLDAIIASTPEDRRCDLVFLQNGYLSRYLKSKGLQDNTQALVYFAVSKLGEAPIDGITDMNPEGLTSVTGKWADDFASRMEALDLTCHIVDADKFKISMLEKHIWICAFMAVGSKHGCTVGEVEKEHSEEIRAVIAELAAAAAKRERVKFPEGIADRLCAYARSVAHFPTALKEFEWRNSYFSELSLSTVQFTPYPDPCPLHTEIIIDSPGSLIFKARQSLKAKVKEANSGPIKEIRSIPDPNQPQAGDPLPSNPEAEEIWARQQRDKKERRENKIKEEAVKKASEKTDGYKSK